MKRTVQQLNRMGDMRAALPGVFSDSSEARIYSGFETRNRQAVAEVDNDDEPGGGLKSKRCNGKRRKAGDAHKGDAGPSGDKRPSEGATAVERQERTINGSSSTTTKDHSP